MTRNRLSIILLPIFLAVTFVGCTGTQTAPEPEGVEVVGEYDISGLHGPLNDNTPTVDVVIFHSDNAEVTWEQLREEFHPADRVFRSYGVQFHLKKAFDVTHRRGNR